MSAIASGRRAASALGFGRGAYSWLPRRFSSQIVKSVDTVALARRLEAQGLPSNQAEAITATFTELLNDSLENISNSLLKPESEMTQDSILSKFKSEVKSSQEHHLELLQNEIGILRYKIEELRRDKSKLDRELREARDEVTKFHEQCHEVNHKIDEESNRSNVQFVEAKFDIINYFWTLPSITVAGYVITSFIVRCYALL